jgi:hypothetical protein
VQSGDQNREPLPSYEFTSDWGDLTAVPDAATSWAHSGLVITSGGELIGFHAGQLVTFDRQGRVLRILRPGLTEGHGITLVREGDEEFLWIADPGFVHVCDNEDGDEAWAPLFGKGVHVDSREPRVVKISLGGEVLLELPIPPVDPAVGPGMMGDYCPCGTAVDEERFGGTGDIWVADGYGSSLVHRFDKQGNHVSVLTGEEGGGRFVCPHAVYIDRRPHKDPELYIADRENKRVQIYDLQGGYTRTIGEGFLNSPSGFTQWGDALVIAELYARLAVLDENDKLIGYIGNDPNAKNAQGWPERPGWPNELTDNGFAQTPYLKHSDRFNSPHSVAVDNEGNLYVSEWLIGGRYTKVTTTTSS